MRDMILGKTNNALRTTRAVCKQDRALLVLDCLQTVSTCFQVKMFHKKFEFFAVLVVLRSIRNSFISKHSCGILTLQRYHLNTD